MTRGEGAGAASAARPARGVRRRPMPMTPAEFDALIRKEIVANAALAKAAGLKAELKKTIEGELT